MRTCAILPVQLQLEGGWSWYGYSTHGKILVFISGIEEHFHGNKSKTHLNCNIWWIIKCTHIQIQVLLQVISDFLNSQLIMEMKRMNEMKCTLLEEEKACTYIDTLIAMLNCPSLLSVSFTFSPAGSTLFGLGEWWCLGRGAFCRRQDKTEKLWEILPHCIVLYWAVWPKGNIINKQLLLWIL